MTSVPSSLGPLSARLRRLWPFFRPARIAMMFAVLATLIAAATEPMIPALLKGLLDQGFVSQTLPFWAIPLGLMGIFGLRGLAGFVAQYMLSYIANTGTLEMRQAMFAKLNKADPLLFQQQTASTLSNTVVYEVQNGANMLGGSWLTTMRDGMTLVALLAYLLFMNWKLTLIVLLLFPAIVWVMQVLSKRIYRITRHSQKATDSLAYVVEENVLAHRMIRLHNAQDQQLGRFQTLSLELKKLALKATVATAAMTPLTQLLAALALSIVLMIALWQSQSQGVTVGGFVGFVTAMLMLINPIKHLADVTGPLTRGLAALERGLELIDTVPTQSEGLYQSVRAQGTLEWRNVKVKYLGRDDFALDDVSLRIEPGQVVALVGASGSGKSTLVNLLPRFVRLESGCVLLDGRDIQSWKLDSLRSQIAFVSQDVIMLNDTIANNVSLGAAKDVDKVRSALHHANLLEWVEQLPYGIESLVGHNATELSGGQRQRLAIARALYKNAPILVLDEATSALDNQSERLIQQALEHLMQGRTTLMVAHRLSTIEHADRVIVFEKGRIVEQGDHKTLMSLNGAYAALQRSTMS